MPPVHMSTSYKYSGLKDISCSHIWNSTNSYDCNSLTGLCALGHHLLGT
jgi:hypothetical protein